MSLCKHCRANLPEEAKYCGQCGQKQEICLSVSPPSFLDTSTKSYGKDNEQTGQEMTEHERHTPVLLSPELYKQLIEWYRNNDYKQLNNERRKLASDIRSTAASALTWTLRDQAFDTLQLPHGSFGTREPEQISRAKELISKEDAADREKGLKLLKDLKASRAFNAHPVVEEWYLFAEALVHGLGQAIPEWQKKRANGKASEEDVWNLAVFYAHQLDFKQVLEVLGSDFDVPGRDKKHLSFAQLRFALYCAAQLLDQEPEANRTAVVFLRRHLNKWPEPACFLVWMLLEEQEGQFQGADHQLEQIEMWKTLNTLLNQPIRIPELNKRPGARDVRCFLNQLQQIDFHETVILWLNDFARYSGTKFERLDDEMRQALVKAYEAIGTIDQAADVLYKIALEQCSIFQRQRGSDGSVPDKAIFFMRKALVDLFTFHKRHSSLERKDVFERFERLHRDAPELWCSTEERNKQLITLTHSLLEKATQHHSEMKISLQPAQVQPTKKGPLSVEIAIPDQPLSYHNSETLLQLRVSHKGSGKARDIVIRVTGLQSEQKALVSKRDERLDGLEQGETGVVDIPVALNPVPGREWLECRVDLLYQWDGEKRSTSHPLKIRYREAKKRVGVFVDYENAFPSVRGRGDREVGEALITYASQFGEVVCRWAIAHPRNMNGTNFKICLEQAGFQVGSPHEEPQTGKVPKKASDFALITHIIEEQNKTQPDIYIIVSGDVDYYEVIRTLIDNGKTVRLCGSQPRLSEKYRDLIRERKLRSKRQSEGIASNFFIDDFDTVMQVLGQKGA